MKNLALIIIICVLGAVFTLESQAQRTNISSGNPAIKGSLDSQFFHLNRISRNQEGFKLIRRGNLDFIQHNVLDSIQRYQGEIIQKTEEIAELEERKSQLTDSLQAAHRELLVVENESQMVRLLGISMSLVIYHWLVWVLILTLLVTLVLVLIRFRQHRVNARDALESLSTIQEEYDTFRKKSLEKEQKLKRQLQDEINKGNA